MSDTPIDEVLAEMAGGIPLEPMPKTHYADPDTIATLARLERENAALRERAEQAELDRDMWKAEVRRTTDEYVKTTREALAEAERLRADAERYRWLRDLSLARKKMSVYVGQTFYSGDVACNRFLHGKEMDAAIDSAMGDK